MERLYIKLKGRTPLLMNNPKETLGGGEEEPTKTRKKQPLPEEQAKIRRYLLPDGNFYMPATAVHGCMLTACSGYTAKGETGRKVAVLPLLSGALIMTDPAFPLLDDKDNPIPGDRYEVDIQRVRVPPRTGASFWRGRPKIWPWNLLCWFNFDSRRIDLELVGRIAKDAGMYPGLLDGRPEKKESFGTFEVIGIWSE